MPANRKKKTEKPSAKKEAKKVVEKLGKGERVACSPSCPKGGTKTLNRQGTTVTRFQNAKPSAVFGHLGLKPKAKPKKKK